MDFKNLYALLKIKPTASQSDIAKAMRQAAQQQTITLDDLKLCKQYLLNEEERTKYDERLFAAHPELLAPPPEPEPEPEKAEEAKPLAPAKTKQGNKKLYLILAAVAAAIALIAGTVAYFKHFKPIAEAKEAVRDLLKDPDSAKFYNVEKVVNTHVKKVSICGQVNAKATAGGYAGKKMFLYTRETKRALIIPATKPKELTEEFSYSSLYKAACLNVDPEKINADMATYKDTLEKLVSLQRQRLNASSDEEQERLDKAIATTKAKSEEEWANITIYTDSDDD
ncbi:hypothetical protein BGI15_03225 [Snodgrassella alvi]|uniref:hypothetical protein n=1 Tax=Snodgrassella alvi TaxID=1196083 RepID=UPI000A04EABC|nr:hypothetical protein [Snodgrassella alvi]ORF23836.1 hypothetical protein BGI07_10020 [Snodgrassella alvi]ORF29429.1 hypothetical protein BGI10_10790 [Snodgrassella alvi]ORF34943.1 hypothetical protein BGI11_03265 [Snodgrassella alvi]ORF38223.1 hypothetical protein BGI14_09905 [Snodgrassella alvi]ORF40785.1 hypothetical protein BGI13_01005 [Snodgrassella alvi]